MKYRYIMILAVVGLTRSLIASDSAETILAAVRDTTLKVTDFKAIVTQTTQTPFSTSPMVETGWIYRKGNRTRREIQKPAPKVSIQCPDWTAEKDGTTGKISRSESPPSHSMEIPMQSLDLNPDDAIQKMNLRSVSETETEWNLAGQYQRMALTLVVSKRSHLVTSMKIVDESSGLSVDIINTEGVVDSIPIVTKSVARIQMRTGNGISAMSSTTEYRGIKINQGLPDTLFEIKSLE